MKFESNYDLGENVYTPYKAFAGGIGIIKRVKIVGIHVKVNEFCIYFSYLVRNLENGMEHDEFPVDEGLLFREHRECFEYIS